jgi:hypothetical protein
VIKCYNDLSNILNIKLVILHEILRNSRESIHFVHFLRNYEKSTKIRKHFFRTFVGEVARVYAPLRTPTKLRKIYENTKT